MFDGKFSFINNNFSFNFSRIINAFFSKNTQIKHFLLNELENAVDKNSRNACFTQLAFESFLVEDINFFKIIGEIDKIGIIPKGQFKWILLPIKHYNYIQNNIINNLYSKKKEVKDLFKKKVKSK